MKKRNLFLTSITLLCSLMIYSQNKPYKSGEIYTANEYQYGKMEVRMLAATGSGVISNFFTFKEGSELPTTFWEEIDIEVFGKDGANSWQSNLITGQGNSNLIRTEGVHQQNGLGEAYHTYTIEWKPDAVIWSVDGVVIRTITGGQANDVDDLTSLRFNLWNPNIPQWVGPFNQNILPVHMYVNWIKFYEWNGDSFSSSLTFEDNFDTLDDAIWTKANHTFAENQADFIPENVTAKDGYLVLSLTKDGETGFEGTPPVDGETNTNTPIAAATASISIGQAPLSVSFDASDSSDPEGESLSYSWDFGDNTTGTGVTPTHIYTNNGVYTAVVTVSNTSGGSATATVEITVESDDEVEPGNCLFNTPIEIPLPSINRSFTTIEVLGTGGPDLSNVTNFTINWSQPNNGLWQMSLNTNNGIPNWWMDLRSVSDYSLNNAQPSINFSGTGITGLDGDYDVTTVGDDFVMVSKTASYAIYFTESTTVPSCEKTALTKDTAIKNSLISVTPNPSSTSFAVTIANKNDAINDTMAVVIYDITGRKINKISTFSENSDFHFGENLNAGMYFVKILDNGAVIQETTIVKK